MDNLQHNVVAGAGMLVAAAMLLPVTPGMAQTANGGAEWPAAQASAPAGRPAYSIPGLEISGVIGEDQKAGEINALIPLMMRSARQALFLGLDGKLFGDGVSAVDKTVYNVGGYLGYRERIGESVFGVWAGVDHLQSRYGHAFNRFIAGADYFGPRIIARVNGFVPIDSTSKEWSVTNTAVTSDAFNITTTTTTVVFDEKIPSGIDGEIGARFALRPLHQDLRASELRAFVGGYDYFGLKADGGNVPGFKGRLELDLYPFRAAQDVRLTLEGQYSHDAYAGDQLRGGVRLAIPFGGSGSHGQQVASAGGRGSIKDAPAPFGGSIKDGPAPSGGMSATAGSDLFQPVRRNREPVSVVRVKRVASTATTTPQPLSVANACGGPGAIIPGIVEYGGTPIPLGATFPAPFDTVVFDLASMTVTDPGFSGQTLAQVLASPTRPAIINLLAINSITNPFGSTSLSIQVQVPVDGSACSGNSGLAGSNS